jgi:hypothetical protein
MRRLIALLLAVLLVGGGVYLSVQSPAKRSVAASVHRGVFGAHGSGRIFGATPVNEVLPAISGTAEEGKELSVSTGTWKFATAYAYQWQKCNNAGTECVNIVGETSALIVLTGYAGKKLRVVVTASNSGAEASVTSAASEEIKAGAGVATECFKKIVEKNEECGGDPAESTTGVEGGVTLTNHAGALFVSKDGEVIKEKKIEGALEIKANNVTVENVEVVATELKKVCEKVAGAKSEGSGAVQLQSKAGAALTGFVMKHSTIRGVTKGCPESLGEGINIKDGGDAAQATFEWVNIHWVGKCIHQAATYEHVFCDTNAELPNVPGTAFTGAHYDGIFANGEGTTSSTPGLVVKHSTILMPHWQTSPLFLPNEHEWGEAVFQENLFAGGGYILYPPVGGAGIVKGPVNFTRNRVARCHGTPFIENSHHLCTGLSGENETTEAPTAPDSFGYYPLGGSYGTMFATPGANVHSTENFWDDTLESVVLG